MQFALSSHTRDSEQSGSWTTPKSEHLGHNPAGFPTPPQHQCNKQLPGRKQWAFVCTYAFRLSQRTKQDNSFRGVVFLNTCPGHDESFVVFLPSTASLSNQFLPVPYWAVRVLYSPRPHQHMTQRQTGPCSPLPGAFTSHTPELLLLLSSGLATELKAYEVFLLPFSPCTKISQIE